MPSPGGRFKSHRGSISQEEEFALELPTPPVAFPLDDQQPPLSDLWAIYRSSCTDARCCHKIYQRSAPRVYSCYRAEHLAWLALAEISLSCVDL